MRLTVLCIGLFSFLLLSCGGPNKLRPTESSKETSKLLKKKNKAHKKKWKRAERRKRKTGYYGGIRALSPLH
ncbi:MAG: hypothetical protein IT233_07245 [Bacteroidia bacterium]|nr:hypothetical protein [Bacteroidia bacterium]